MHSFSSLLSRSLQSGLAVLALAVLLLPLACSPDQNVGSDAEASPNTLTQAERDADGPFCSTARASTAGRDWGATRSLKSTG